jgi:hypothetical protein
MDLSQIRITAPFITLKEAACLLAVDVDTLIEWNNNNILKPTITPDGKIGYPRQQLEKFIAIQKLSQNQKDQDKQETTTHLPDPTMNSHVLQSPGQDTVRPDVAPLNSKFDTNINATNMEPPRTNVPANIFQTKTFTGVNKEVPGNSQSNSLDGKRHSKPEFSLKNRKDKYYFLGLCSLCLILVVLVLFSGQQSNNHQFTNVPVDIEPIYNDISSEAELNSNLSKDTHTFLIVKEENVSNDSDGLYLAAPDFILSLAEQNSLSGYTNKVERFENQYVPQPEIGYETEGGKEFETLRNFYGSTTNSASRPNTGTNIKDGDLLNRTAADIIAINSGIDDLTVYSGSLGQNRYLNVSVILLLVGLLTFNMLIKRRPAYVPLNTGAVPLSPSDTQEISKLQKVLEVVQKTDGTVVLNFSGQEYKVSKPELNSESDQFIERLMDFAGSDAKEVNYDILKDEKLKLNAPLSKLVTRLGFVGIKRELFFPRTAKNSVLFRRYLTREDLASMGLTEDQISNGLIAN